MSTLAQYEAEQDRAQMQAHAAEDRLPVTPEERAAIVDMADRAIARHIRAQEHWLAVRRAALTGAVPPAAVPDDEVF